MSLFTKCVTFFISISILLVVLYELYLYPDMPLAGNILFGTFGSLMLSIFYGWMDDMFGRRAEAGAEQ